MIYKVRLNDKVYEVDVTEGEASLVSESLESEALTPAPSSPSAPLAVVRTVQSNANIVKAPFPGIVTAVKVSVGDIIKAGQVVAVIEAMKMENEIVSAKSGKVNHIHVVKGAQVSTGSPLIDFI